MVNPTLKLSDPNIARDINNTIKHLRTFTDQIIFTKNNYKKPSNENEMAQKVIKSHHSVNIETRTNHVTQGASINIAVFSILIFFILKVLLNLKGKE